MENRKAHPAGNRPRRGIRTHRGEDRAQLRSRVRHRTFFEDTDVVRGLQQQFPAYAGNFPVWSEQTSAMHQLAVWTMLEDAGLGASLQHYNPLIDDEVRKRWSLPGEWKLVAQMPFGTPAGEPGEKTFKPLDERIRVFR